ncbi:hypothetical protein GRC12_18150 [Streptomyces griseorubiginosus]|nr:hypothetical protein [Streptomyces griseorubiginosus]
MMITLRTSLTAGFLVSGLLRRTGGSAFRNSHPTQRILRGAHSRCVRAHGAWRRST